MKTLKNRIFALVAGTLLAAGTSIAAHAQPLSASTPSNSIIAPSPFAYISTCTSTAYKVIFRQVWQSTDSYACFTGSGTWTPPATVTNNLEYIRGVCPGNNIGRIQYRLANGNYYNSTWRGPHSNNTSTSYCYFFSGDMPTHLVNVQIQ